MDTYCPVLGNAVRSRNLTMEATMCDGGPFEVAHSPATLGEVRQLLKWARRNPHAMRRVLNGSAGVYLIKVDDLSTVKNAGFGGFMTVHGRDYRLDTPEAQVTCTVTNDHVEL